MEEIHSTQRTMRPRHHSALGYVLGLQAEGSGDFSKQTHPHIAMLLFETFLRSTEQTGEKWFVFTFFKAQTTLPSAFFCFPGLFELTQILKLEAASGTALLFPQLSRWSSYSLWHREPLRQGWVEEQALGKQRRRRLDRPSSRAGLK